MDFHNLKAHVTARDIAFFKSLSDIEPQVLNACQCHKSKDTLLHIMCRLGCDDILRYFIQELGVDIEICNNDGKRPLHEAAQFSQYQCLRILLENGVQVDPLKRADWTPLMLACTKDNIDVVSSLLKAGADPTLRNKDGWNSFHIACREGHMPIIEAVYRNSPSVKTTKSNNLRTPLHTAALHGHTEVVYFLTETCGCKPEVQDSCGVTPAMDALRLGHVEVARKLKVASQNEEYISLEDKTGRQAIHHAAQNGQLEALAFLVTECGISHSETSQSGETPLHIAAQEGKLKAIELLLTFGADVNAQDHRGRTALHKASGCQHEDCVKLLLRYRGKLWTDSGGITPQQLARKATLKQVFIQYQDSQ